MAKILVVDDDPDIVESLRLFLEAEGHTVLTAGGRREGMEKLAEKPDLIVLDVMMEEPDDGVVMSRDVRRRGCKVPILMLTAISRVTRFNYTKDDEMIPVDAFVEKPVDPKTLVRMVAQLLAEAAGKGGTPC